MNKFRKAAVLLLLAVQPSCSGKSPSKRIATSSAIDQCWNGAQSNRWALDESASVTVVRHDESRSLGFGIAQIHGKLFALDRGKGGIALQEEGAGERSVIGSTGIGVGQILPVGGIARISPRSRRVDWLSSESEGVLLLDGRSLHKFSTMTGQHVKEYSEFSEVLLGHPPLFSSRLRSHGASVLVDVEYSFGYKNKKPDRDRRELTIWKLGQGDPEMVFRMRLVPLPTVREGLVHHGSSQAVALWDEYNGCIVASDGSAGRLLISAIGSTTVDTLALATILPAPPSSTGDSATLSLAGQTGDAPPGPTLLKRVRRLSIDPDGWIWLEMVSQDPLSETVRVLKVHPRSGEEASGEMPFFPSLFPSASEIVGLRSEPGGGVALLRSTLRSTAGGKTSAH